MTRFLARLLVRLLRHPEVQAELRQAIDAQQPTSEQTQALFYEGIALSLKGRD